MCRCGADGFFQNKLDARQLLGFIDSSQQIVPMAIDSCQDGRGPQRPFFLRRGSFGGAANGQ
jgi:hypothetical protein